MADFKLLGGTDPATQPLGQMTQGLGFPLRDVDPATSGGQVVVVHEEVIRAASPLTQEPTAVDTPLQITFGDAQVTGKGVDVDANGVFTCTAEGDYAIRIRLQLGRTSNPTSSIMFSRFLVNGVQIAAPIFTQLADSNDQIPTSFEGVIPLTAGDEFTIEIHRSSAGANSGGVFAATSALWGVAPSAQIIVTKTVAIET